VGDEIGLLARLQRADAVGKAQRPRAVQGGAFQCSFRRKQRRVAARILERPASS